MKRKKFFGIVTIGVIMAFTLSACNKEPAALASSVDDTQPIVIEEVVSEEPESESESISSVEASEVASEKPAPVQEEAKGDPKLVPLEVTEEWAKANQLVCLYRNGKLYSLGPYIPVESMEEWIIGQKVDDERAALFMVTDFPGESEYAGDIMVFGPAPNIVLDDGDEIRDYGGLFDGYFGVYKFAGYAPTVWPWRDSLCLYEFYDSLEPLRIDSNVAKKIEVTDSNGNSINLDEWPKCFELNEEYTLSYHIGVDYYEFKLWSDSSVYCKLGNRVFDESAFEYTKDGYGIINVSSLEPGVYAMNAMMPIEIR